MNYKELISKTIELSDGDANRFMRTAGVLDLNIHNDDGLMVDLNANKHTITFPAIVNNEQTFITQDLADRLTQSVRNVHEIKSFMLAYKNDADNTSPFLHTIDFLIQDIDIVEALVDVFVTTQYPDALYNALTAHYLPCFVPEPNYDSVPESERLKEFRNHKISAKRLLESYAKDMNIHMDYTVYNDLQMVTSILDFVSRNSLPLRRCPVCHKIFISDKGNHRYCSDSCKRKGYKASRKQFVSEPFNRAVKNMKQRINGVDIRIIDKEKLRSPFLSEETNALIDQAWKEATSGSTKLTILKEALNGVTNDIRESVKCNKLSEEQAIKILNDYGRSRSYYVTKN